MQYMKMPQNKFWGWVIASTLLGLAIGLVIMFVSGASASNRIAALETQLAGASTDSSAALAAAEARAASAEASVAALSDQVTQLTADLAVAQAGGTTEPSTPATPTITVKSRTITPGTVDASHTITLTAKVTGSPSKVTMRVYNASKSYDKTYTLHKVSTSGGTQTWRATAKAPATVGSYHYYATAIKGSVRVTMPGVSPSLLKVK
jgi:hypothetical protein